MEVFLVRISKGITEVFPYLHVIYSKIVSC